jgi:hypothetical protein
MKLPIRCWIFFSLMCTTSLSVATPTQADPFCLPAGTGCEHIIVVEHPKWSQLAVTVRTESRRWRRADPSGLGFAFIGLERQKPTLLSVQSPETLRTKGEPVGHTWMGLAAHTKGPLAEGGLVLAAATKSGSYGGRWSKPKARVEFFTWDLKSPTPKLKRCRIESTPEIEQAGGADLNAIAIASNGDVYASKFGKYFGSLDDATFATANNLTVVQEFRPGSVYLSRRGVEPWVEVAASIPGANGLFLSANEQRIAINSYLKGVVLVLQRDPTTGLFSSPQTVVLSGGYGPDNLSSLGPNSAAALATPKIRAAFATLFGSLFGSTFGIRPPADVWQVDVVNSTDQPRKLLEIPAGKGLFSVATKFGDWWLCGQIMGPGIYCIPVETK